MLLAAFRPHDLCNSYSPLTSLSESRSGSRTTYTISTVESFLEGKQRGEFNRAWFAGGRFSAADSSYPAGLSRRQWYRIVGFCFALHGVSRDTRKVWHFPPLLQTSAYRIRGSETFLTSGCLQSGAVQLSLTRSFPHRPLPMGDGCKSLRQ